MFAVIYAYSSTPYVVWVSISTIYVDNVTAPFADELIVMEYGDSKYITYGDIRYLVIRVR